MFHVFPHGLEATLLVPVLLGVLVNASFTELFGWDFVGLVVPGYLCSVMMLQPLVAAVVIAEAIATWALARAVDGAATRAGIIDPVFGRDRFYLILVVSVIVRAVAEGLVLPAALASLRPHWPHVVRFEPDLFGIGLVLVPLTANRFWKTGLRSGLFQLGTEVAAVWLLLQALLALTNFSVAGFELSFDRVALGFLAAPGAQIVLLCTAALASHFNRRFGWDAHGILVPALLGLVVTAPLKMLATVVETALIIAVLALVVRLPRLRQLNLEGPRKVVLCFTAGFLIRALFVATLGRAYPGYRASDLFGFGYLLPSLLAERVLARGRVTMVVLTTVQTALIGIPLAGGVALALDRLAPNPAAARALVAAEHYVSLAAAVAAQAHTGDDRARGLADETLAQAGERLLRGPADAVTDDGYQLVRAAGSGALLAWPSGAPSLPAEVWVVVPGDGSAERAAAAAAVKRAALLVAADGDARAVTAARMGATARHFTDAGPPAAGTVIDSPAFLRALVLPPAPTPATTPPAATHASVPPARALREAAFRLERDRQDARRLATSLRPLGLRVQRSREGHLLIDGDGWPQVILRAGAAQPLVVAPHQREVRTAAAGLAAAELLHGDCVLGGDDAAPDDDSAAVVLALALNQQRRRPLLLVRGTDDRLTGDLLIFSIPETDAAWPAWAAPLEHATSGWLLPARLPADAAAALRRFPAGAGFLSDVTLLWLSPRARLALAGESDLGRPDFVELAAHRGVPVVRGDLGDWLLAGKGAPPPATVAAAERLAASGDPMILQRRIGGAQSALLIDAARGLTGLGLTVQGRRAVIVGGDRRNERTEIASPAAATQALGHGTRTLLAGGTFVSGRRLAWSLVAIAVGVAVSRVRLPASWSSGSVRLADLREEIAYRWTGQPLRFAIPAGGQPLRLLVNLNQPGNPPVAGTALTARIVRHSDGVSRVYPLWVEPGTDDRGQRAVLYLDGDEWPSRSALLTIQPAHDRVDEWELALETPSSIGAVVRLLVHETRAANRGRSLGHPEVGFTATDSRQPRGADDAGVQADDSDGHWTRLAATPAMPMRRIYFRDAATRPAPPPRPATVTDQQLMALTLRGPGAITLHAAAASDAAGNVTILTAGGQERTQAIRLRAGESTTVTLAPGQQTLRLDGHLAANVTVIGHADAADTLASTTVTAAGQLALTPRWASQEFARAQAEPATPVVLALAGRHDAELLLRARLLMPPGESQHHARLTFRLIDGGGRVMDKRTIDLSAGPAPEDRGPATLTAALSAPLSLFLWPPAAAQTVQISASEPIEIAAASPGWPASDESPAARTDDDDDATLDPTVRLRFGAGLAHRTWFPVRPANRTELLAQGRIDHLRFAPRLEKKPPPSSLPAPPVAPYGVIPRHDVLAVQTRPPTPTTRGLYWPLPANQDVRIGRRAAPPALLYLGGRQALRGTARVFVDGKLTIRAPLFTARGRLHLPLADGAHRLRVEVPAGVALYISRPIEGATPMRFLSMYTLDARRALHLRIAKGGARRTLGVVLYGAGPLRSTTRLQCLIDGGRRRAYAHVSQDHSRLDRDFTVATHASPGARALNSGQAPRWISDPMFIVLGDDLPAGVHDVQLRSGAPGPLMARLFVQETPTRVRPQIRTLAGVLSHGRAIHLKGRPR